MSKETINKVEYVVTCINEFANIHHISANEAAHFLIVNGGIDYLDEFYDIEHTLSINETMEALEKVCKKSGKIQ